MNVTCVSGEEIWRKPRISDSFSSDLKVLYRYAKLWEPLLHGLSTLAIEIHFTAELSSNPNKIHLNRLTKKDRQADEFAAKFYRNWT